MANFDWTPQSIQDYAGELNKVGAFFRNAVACVYNTFTYEVSKYWTGKNYNNIAQHINGYYESYESMINNLAVVIPGRIQDVALRLANDGGGNLDAISYSADAPGVDVVSFTRIPETSVSADGRITLTQEKAHRYFNEDVEPSVPYYTRLMVEYLDMYDRKFDEYGSQFENTEAVKEARSAIESYKYKVKNDIAKIESVIQENANKELGIIENVDVETKEKARRNVSDFGPNVATAAGVGVGAGASAGFVATVNTNENKKYSQADLDSAREKYEKAKTDYDNNKSTYRTKYDEAKEEFTKETGCSSNPEDIEARRQQYDKDIAELRKKADEDPNNYSKDMNWSIEKKRKESFEEAAKKLEKARKKYETQFDNMRDYEEIKGNNVETLRKEYENIKNEFES